jgi:ABC-type uncharacterized transport system substrate-binding protein
MRSVKRRGGALLPIMALALGMMARPEAATAHPHVWVDVKTRLLFDQGGRLTGFRHDWRFDEGYSSFAVMGLDTDQNGTLTREELAPLAQVNMESLGEYDFFTFLSVGDDKVALLDPVDYHVDYENGRAELHFTLPLQTPLEVRQADGSKRDVSFQIYDPTFYVDFAFAKDAPLTLGDGAPAGCRTDYQPPADAAPVAQNLAEADFSNPDVALGYATASSSPVHIVCAPQEDKK